MPDLPATPVEVVAPNPIPVKVIEDLSSSILSGDKRKEIRQNQDVDPSIPARTTYQQDLVTASQRNVNLIWETTQRDIAKYVIVGAVVINGVTVLIAMITGREISATVAFALGFINSLASGIASFYFGRTNHTQTGGIGPKNMELTEAHR